MSITYKVIYGVIGDTHCQEIFVPEDFVDLGVSAVAAYIDSQMYLDEGDEVIGFWPYNGGPSKYDQQESTIRRLENQVDSLNSVLKNIRACADNYLEGKVRF